MATVSSIYVCIKQFNARLGDELNLKVGDKIEILADDSEYNDGWYMGRNIVSSEVGLFPKSFTRVSVETQLEQPTLLRSRSRRVPTGNSLASGTSHTSDAAQKPANDVHSTLNEIDKALNELRVSSGEPDKGHLRSESAQLLTQDLNPLKAAEWTPKQVSSYFAIVLGFDMAIAGKFARHKITGEILFALDLAHLKELEIDSFGTRFEVYKEIEKLKQISSRVKSKQNGKQPEEPLAVEKPELLPPANNSDDDKPPQKTHLHLSKSQSHLLPSAPLGRPSEPVANGKANSAKVYHQRTRSQSAENILFQTPKNVLDSPNATTFMSPRKAPEPPSTSPMNHNYKFGGSPVTPTANVGQGGQYMTRTNASSGMVLRPASSVYDSSVLSHHRRGSSGVSHKRHSSVFLFLSGTNDDGTGPGVGNGEKLQSQNLYKNPASPGQQDKRTSKFFKEGDLTILGDEVHIDDVNLSPKKSRSALDPKNQEFAPPPLGRLKSLRSVSTQNFKSLTGLKKLKTSAFQEGIRDINPDDAIKSSNFSGWMSKKSGSTLGWRSRYFTLHGTRLSYFTSLRDKREKGLIDITAHKVIPISTEADNSGSNDKYIALYASSTGFGRFCFKLVPPAPGFKKGLTFTQPKTHYFAVETQEEMRGWLKALMTATIDIDDTVPVVSSCNTPTVTLAKAQELLAKAREETKLKDEELRAKGLRGGQYNEDSLASTLLNDSATSDEASPLVASIDDTTISSTGGAHPKLSVDTLGKVHRSPTTPQASNHSGGFASPYLLASGLLSPKQNSGTTPASGGFSSVASTPQGTFLSKADYFSDHNGSKEIVNPPVDLEDLNRSEVSIASPRTERSVGSGAGSSKKKTADKLMAYTSDGSFVIKTKKK